MPDTLPVVLIGYSTGAEQAVAGAAWHTRPKGLAGVLLIAPGQRARYGITRADLMGISPHGGGSFALADFGLALDGLRVVQIHGEYDFLDSTKWLSVLRAPHKLKVYPDGWHSFKGGAPDFLKMLDDEIDWIIALPGQH